VEEVQSLTDGKGVNYIIDGVGNQTFNKNLQACSIRGHITLFGHASGPSDPISPHLLQPKSITLTGGNLMNYLFCHEELIKRANVLMDDIKNKKIKVHIGHVFPIEEAARGQKLLESRKSTGKIILTVN
jgi:NADPH2:quinone reductase